VNLRRLAPSAVTLLGHVLSLAWLLGLLGWPWGLAGLVCDAIDGRVARRLGAETEAGGLYDWLVDCTTAALLCVALGVPWALVPLLPAQALCRARGIRWSGRALLMCVALALDAASA